MGKQTMTPAEKLARAKAKKGGWGWFGDLVGDVVDMAKNPLDTGKALVSEAKQTFIDPITGLADAANPFMEQRPIDRVNKAAAGVLAAADFLTPALPEGALAGQAARKLSRRAAQPVDAVVDIMGIGVPRGSASLRYKMALDKMARGAPTRSTASIGTNLEAAQDIADTGIIDPILAKTGIGMTETMPTGYGAVRNEIENVTNAPVYGYYRRFGDTSTAAGYRDPRLDVVDEGAIFSIRPGAVRSTSDEDSFAMWLNAKNAGGNPKGVFRKFDPTSPAPLPQQAAGAYQEVQMRPLAAADIESVDLLRPSLYQPHQNVIDAQTELARRLAAQGVQVRSGQAKQLSDILAPDIRRGIYPQKLQEQVRRVSGFVPDRVPLQKMTEAQRRALAAPADDASMFLASSGRKSF